MDEDRLHEKYEIRKTSTGETLDGPAFVLRIDRDPTARKALWEYAKHCGYPLSRNLTDWLHHVCLHENIDPDYDDGHHFPWEWYRANEEGR